jgi:hypothetical protein
MRGEEKVTGLTKDLTLALGEFGQRGLERFARGRTRSADAAVRTAVLYYLSDRDSGRAAWRVPDLGAHESGPQPLNVRLDDATWAALEEEAERQGVTPEALAVHATLYFVADLDSGRLAEALAEALGEET